MKNKGYSNIRIYNGGIKDWKKSGLPVKSIDPLPDVETRFIDVEEFLPIMQSAESQNCKDENGQPLLTLLDLRTERHIDTDDTASSTVTEIKTTCPTIFCLLDELQNPQVRQQIPKQGLVVTITETGNRDKYAAQFMSKFGYTNLKGLRFGMRGWIKKDYPVKTRSLTERP